MVVSCEEQPTEQSVGDNDGVLSTTTFLHVSVQRLQEGGHTVIDVSSTARKYKVTKCTLDMVDTVCLAQTGARIYLRKRPLIC